MSEVSVAWISALWNTQSAKDFLLCVQQPGAGGQAWFAANACEKITAEMEKRATHGNVWLSVCGFQSQSRKAANAYLSPGIVIDIDVVGHKSEDGKDSDQDLPTQIEAYETLNLMPVQPSIVFETGGGLQAWWVFPNPVAFSHVKPVAAAVEEHYRGLLGGKHLDSIAADGARVVRVPGILNHKYGDVVSVEDYTDIDDQLEMIEDMTRVSLLTIKKAVGEVEVKAPVETAESSASASADQAIANSVSDRPTYSGPDSFEMVEALLDRLDPVRKTRYQDWVMVGMALAHWGGEQGPKLWMEWSVCDDYPASDAASDEMMAKWRSFGNLDNPITLGTIAMWAKQDTPEVSATVVRGITPLKTKDSSEERSWRLVPLEPRTPKAERLTVQFWVGDERKWSAPVNPEDSNSVNKFVREVLKALDDSDNTALREEITSVVEKLDVAEIRSQYEQQNAVPEQPKLTIDQLVQKTLDTTDPEIVKEAEDLLHDPNLWKVLCRQWKLMGIEGELKLCGLVYGQIISCALNKPYNVLANGSTSTGKTFVTDTVLNLCPPEILLKVNSWSDQALVYMGKSDMLKHRLIRCGERPRSSDMEKQAARTEALRQLITDGEYHRTIVVPVAGEEPKAVQLTVKGPISAIETTTLPLSKIFREDLNRYIVSQLTDTQEHHRRVLERKSRQDVNEADHDYLRAIEVHRTLLRMVYLEATKARQGDTRTVWIPWLSEVLAMMPDMGEAARLVEWIQSVATASCLLHHKHRETRNGVYVANRFDYEIVRALAGESIELVLMASDRTRESYIRNYLMTHRSEGWFSSETLYEQFWGHTAFRGRRKREEVGIGSFEQASTLDKNRHRKMVRRTIQKLATTGDIETRIVDQQIQCRVTGDQMCLKPLKQNV